MFDFNQQSNPQQSSSAPYKFVHNVLPGSRSPGTFQDDENDSEPDTARPGTADFDILEEESEYNKPRKRPPVPALPLEKAHPKDLKGVQYVDRGFSFHLNEIDLISHKSNGG